MITGMSIATVRVLDQASAKSLCTDARSRGAHRPHHERLPLAHRGGEEQPELELTLVETEPPAPDPESAEWGECVEGA